MTEVDTLKARIVELERQSVKALEGLMKANDRLLASTKLQRWGDEKPDVGRDFIVYCRWDKEPVICNMKDSGPEHTQYNWSVQHMGYGDGGYMDSDVDICDHSHWCYVPSAPNWDRIKS